MNTPVDYKVNFILFTFSFFVFVRLKQNFVLTFQSTMPVVSIAINDSIHADSSLYRLNRKTVLHIVPGSSLLGRRVALYCNLPVTG